MGRKTLKLQSKINRSSYHLVFCYGKKQSCAKCDRIEESYNEIKTQIKKLKHLGIFTTLTLSPCLKVCSEGPILIVHPGGVWYHSCNPKVIRKIFTHHLLQNSIVEENVFSKMNMQTSLINKLKSNFKSESPLNEYFLN